MMHDEVKTAVIGVGIWGEQHIRAYQAHPYAKLIAICDLNEKKLRETAKKYNVGSYYTDCNKMLREADIDAVSIATPDFAHRESAVACANAGKHIIVEKPLATTVEDCQSIINAVKENGVKLMVDFHCRWVLPFMQIKQSVESGELGEPMHAFIRLSDTLFVPRKMLSWASNTNEAWFLGSHCIDLLRWILTDEVKRVFALSQSKVLKEEGINCPDYFQVLLEFEKGTSALVENSWLLPENSSPSLIDFRLELFGSKGAVYANAAQNSAIAKYTDQPSDQPHYPHPDMFFLATTSGKPRGGAIQGIWHFVDALSEDKEPVVSGKDGLEVTKVIIAIEESVKRRLPVEVD